MAEAAEDARGMVMAGDPRPNQTAKAVEEQDLDILVANGAAAVNGCNVVMADIKALSGMRYTPSLTISRRCWPRTVENGFAELTPS